MVCITTRTRQMNNEKKIILAQKGGFDSKYILFKIPSADRSTLKHMHVICINIGKCIARTRVLSVTFWI